MSLGEALVRGAVGGIGSFVVGKLLAPFAWDALKSSASHGKELAATALKATSVTMGAFALAGAGYTSACWIHKKTDLTRDGFDLITAGYNERTVERLHRYVPTLTFAASLAPLAYIAVRLVI